MTTAPPQPETAPVRPGEQLDWAALEAHLRANLPELTGEFAPLQFPNGSANLTYLLRFGDTELVLRRPPFGVIAPGAHDMKWYEAFAQWKTGVVVRQLHRRWERGESTDPRMEFVADRLPLLSATASRLLDHYDG